MIAASPVSAPSTPRERLASNTYDKAASLLITLLITVGMVTGTLVFIWFTTRFSFSQQAIPVAMAEEEGAGRGDNPAGVAEDPLPPGAEELPDTNQEPRIEASLEAVTNVVSTNAAAFDNLDTSAATTTKGKGPGDKRPHGPPGHGADTIPRWERWQIRFETTDEKGYAAQLDFFQIELGAVDLSNPTIEYAAQLSRKPPVRRTATRDDENKLDRLFFNWKDGRLQDIDRSFLSKAGVKTANKVIYQFYSKNTENILAQAELDAAKGKKAKDIRKTVFGVKKSGDGFQFVVVEQTFRR